MDALMVVPRSDRRFIAFRIFIYFHSKYLISFLKENRNSFNLNVNYLVGKINKQYSSISNNKTCLNSLLFIEVPLPSQEC